MHFIPTIVYTSLFKMRRRIRVFKSMIDVIIHASCENVPPTHASQVSSQINQSYCQLLQQVGYEAEWPVANFLAQYYGLKEEWLIVSPIHWEATHNDATIRYADFLLTLSDDESRYLFSIFAEFVAHYDMQLYYHDAKTWLIQAPKQPIAPTTPVHDLIDRSMTSALKQLEKTPFWLRFITESQMFFSQEKTVVNGVWLWGEGKINSQSKTTRPLLICGDEHWLTAAKELSFQVGCLNKANPVARQGIYFVPNEHWMKVSHLEDYLKNYTVRWHWQNMTYLTRSQSLLSRLLRR